LQAPCRQLITAAAAVIVGNENEIDLHQYQQNGPATL
jgi:hypothetical protein